MGPTTGKQVYQAGRDALQGASNAAASGVSAPVDLIAAGLRRAGVPVGAAPVGGSEWMQRQGLTKPVTSNAGYVGEALGTVAPMFAAAKAPQIAAGLLKAGDNLANAQRIPMSSQRGAVVVAKTPSPVDAEAERVSRMTQMGLEPGWFRGGPKPGADGRRTGPWYTRDAEEAAQYAKRFGVAGDVREYAIPAVGYLNASAGYSHRLAHDVAKILDDPFYGKGGTQLAAELRTYSPGEGLTGGQLWQALESRFGNDGAADVLSKLGAFKGARGMTGGDEVYVFKTAPVRDAKRAKFALKDIGVDNIMAGLAAPAVAAPFLFPQRSDQD